MFNVIYFSNVILERPSTPPFKYIILRLNFAYQIVFFQHNLLYKNTSEKRIFSYPLSLSYLYVYCALNPIRHFFFYFILDR